jgi:site-specific recombinase XerC
MPANLRVVSPSNEIRSVAPGRAPNAELRSREYLTPAEIERLMKVAREGRHGQRDATLILQRKTKGGFVFETERGGPFTPDAVNRLIKRIGERAGFDYPVHAHMLRHACGYALANAGHDTRAIQDWLGHRSIQHTVRYTELTPTRFANFWR